MNQLTSQCKLPTVVRQKKNKRCNQKCPSCAKATLVPDNRNLAYTYKGGSVIIPNVQGDFCPLCNEGVIDLSESHRISSFVGDFNKRVNSTLVDPGFITAVRKKLRLDKRQASVVFGGGVNAFTRYESGKTKPPVALVKLFKVLEQHPELLAVIKDDYQN